MTLDDLGAAIEALLVEKNLRHMEDLRSALPSGYYLRAAEHLHDARRVIINHLASFWSITLSFNWEEDLEFGPHALLGRHRNRTPQIANDC